MAAITGIISSLRESSSVILDIIYPPVCQVCRLVESTENNIVCGTCWSKVLSITSVASQGAEDAEAALRTDSIAREEKAVPVVALGEYDGPLGEMIRLFKFGGHIDLGIRLGALLAEIALPVFGRWRPELLIPAPLHPSSRKKRGFNQAEILSDILGEGAAATSRRDLLIKTRRTRSQSLLSFEERQYNLMNAFSAHPDELKDKRVALVDDVVTTGATMIELHNTLVEAGAVVVGAVALATAKPEVIVTHPKQVETDG